MNPNASKTRSSSREERGRRLYEAGLVRVPAFPVEDIRQKMRLGFHIFVASEADPGNRDADYAISKVCDCEDFRRHGQGWMCKHRWAVRFAMLEKRCQEQAVETGLEDEIARICDQVADPEYVIPRRGLPSGGVSIHTEDIEEINAMWCVENLGRNETVFFTNGEVIRIPVEHQ